MSLVPVTVSVEEKTYAFAQALVKFAKDLVAATKLGGGTLVEISAIVSAAVADLAPAAGAMSQIPAELKENKAAFVKAWVVAADDFVESVLA